MRKKLETDGDAPKHSIHGMWTLSVAMIAKIQPFEDRQSDISIEIDPLGERQQYKYQR